MFTHGGNKKKVNCLGFWGKHWLLLCLLWGNRMPFCLGCFIHSLVKPCFWTSKTQSFQIFAEERMAVVLRLIRPRSAEVLKWMTVMTLKAFLCVLVIALAIIWPESAKQAYKNYLRWYKQLLFLCGVYSLQVCLPWSQLSGDELDTSTQISYAKFKTAAITFPSTDPTLCPF